ncbi:hypothetical protein ACSDR0_23485 [Streptosporangium sp. G11]|uniref:hypothetical protein n=1 Tax=Streptosporangium sp. G11 TaxID=3436926 RepID=UPI003EBA42AB
MNKIITRSAALLALAVAVTIMTGQVQAVASTPTISLSGGTTPPTPGGEAIGDDKGKDSDIMI